jgi:hypothetical protein|tara:strand:+ start:221 stop:352 length:132 start_codon:yes stop_codon:yes gene_type:complete
MIGLLLLIIVIMMMAQWYPGVLNFIGWCFIIAVASFILFCVLS